MTTRPAELVLEHLLENEGAEASPEDIAHKLGLSASEMYEAVESLRSNGYGIGYVDRHDHKGLALLTMPDRPLAAEVGVRLQTRTVGRHLVYRDEIESTNTLAKELAESGVDQGTAVLARRQTAGRGRRGRTWLNLPGDHVFLSVVLRPAIRAERAFELTMVAAVALAEALESCGVPPEIKWPNDIEVNGRKLAGILSESALDDSGGLRYAVIGVGVNVDTAADEFPDELRGRATSVRVVTGRKGLTASIVAAFLDRLEEWLVLHESLGFQSVLETWRSQSTTLNAEVRALVDGQVVQGIAEDVDESGALLVKDADGKTHRIVAGEVTTLRRFETTARDEQG